MAWLPASAQRGVGRPRHHRRVEENDMRDALNHIVFGWYPYLCLTVFLVGSLHGFKQWMAIGLGGVAGLMCLVGITLLVHRRLFDARIRATSSFGDIAILLLLYAQLVLGLATIPVSLGHLDG